MRYSNRSWNMIQLVHTDSSSADFQALVALLDQDLRIRDGAEHAFYAQYNQTDQIQHVVVAYVNEEAAGCGAFKPFSERAVEVKRMFVRPAFRGQGIAQQVLAELEAWAREHRATQAVLETGQKQPEALRLYQRCGYAIIPNYGQYAGVANSVCLQKTLR